MNIRIPKHKMLIKRVESMKISKGGIEIPEIAQEKRNQGLVVMAGPGIKDEILIDINEGDDIIFGKWGGTKVVVDGVDHIIMDIEEVLMVLPKVEEEA